MRLKATAFRAHDPKWSYLPLSGEGAARNGGRFNPLGKPALYTALTPMLAWREAQQAFTYKAQPALLCAYDIDCEDIADLTNPVVTTELGVNPADLACAWKEIALRGITPPSWAIASRLIHAGFAGIRVQSFAPGAAANDHNAIFWRWMDDRHRVTVIDDHNRLPRDAASWLR